MTDKQFEKLLVAILWGAGGTMDEAYERAKNILRWRGANVA